MIRQKIILHDYDDWEIYAYYAVTTYYVDEIMEMLWNIGVDSQNAKKAYQNLSENKLNTGLCYSNYGQKRTVIVVAKAISAKEAFNSIIHEASHACIHISTALGVDLRSEEYAYLVGDVCMEMFPKIKTLLCDCCREKYFNKHKNTKHHEG